MLDTDPATTPETPICRNAVERLEKVWKANQCIALTIHGGERWEIRDVATFRLLWQLVDRLESIDQIRAGLNSVQRGKALPVDEVFDSLRKKRAVRPI
jgi:hypothetical protein